MKIIYHQRFNGDEIEIIGATHRMRCCDCCLVHDLNFKIKKGRLYMIPHVNLRATAASRRGKEIYKVDSKPNNG